MAMKHHSFLSLTFWKLFWIIMRPYLLFVSAAAGMVGFAEGPERGAGIVIIIFLAFFFLRTRSWNNRLFSNRHGFSVLSLSPFGSRNHQTLAVIGSQHNFSHCFLCNIVHPESLDSSSGASVRPGIDNIYTL